MIVLQMINAELLLGKRSGGGETIRLQASRTRFTTSARLTGGGVSSKPTAAVRCEHERVGPRKVYSEFPSLSSRQPLLVFHPMAAILSPFSQKL